jgi:hypothetical protein
MKVRVKLRFNKLTGEVEEFMVDDEEQRLPEAEHNREHDRIAAEIGGVLEQHPRVREVLPGAPAPAPERAPVTPEVETPRRERQRR